MGCQCSRLVSPFPGISEGRRNLCILHTITTQQRLHLFQSTANEIISSSGIVILSIGASYSDNFFAICESLLVSTLFFLCSIRNLLCSRKSHNISLTCAATLTLRLFLFSGSLTGGLSGPTKSAPDKSIAYTPRSNAESLAHEEFLHRSRDDYFLCPRLLDDGLRVFGRRLGLGFSAGEKHAGGLDGMDCCF